MALDFARADTGRWFLAQLKPGGDQRARQNLARQGIRSFMPSRAVTQRRAGRLHEVVRPLFPGYLFVQVDPAVGAWRRINSTYGVSRLVGFGGAGPSEVPVEFVSGLMARTDEGERLVPVVSDYATGDAVRIVAGPFARQLARIEEVADADRIHVLLEIMGRTVRAGMSPRQVERV